MTFQLWNNVIPSTLKAKMLPWSAGHISYSFFQLWKWNDYWFMEGQKSDVHRKKGKKEIVWKPQAIFFLSKIGVETEAVVDLTPLLFSLESYVLYLAHASRQKGNILYFLLALGVHTNHKPVKAPRLYGIHRMESNSHWINPVDGSVGFRSICSS